MQDFATRSLNISEETPEVAERLLNPNEVVLLFLIKYKKIYKIYNINNQYAL